MTLYTNPFGGNVVASAENSFNTISITANGQTINLDWAINGNLTNSVAAAQFILITRTTNDAGTANIVLPPANQVSPGQDIIIQNSTQFVLTIRDNASNPVVTIPANGTYYLIVSDNTSSAGSWQAVVFGTSPVAVNTIALAANGLNAQAFANQLAVGLSPSNVVTNTRSISSADRARILVYSGSGNSTFGLFAPNTYSTGGQSDFFCGISNISAAQLTIDPGGFFLDGVLGTKVISPNESLLLFSDGTQFYTLGYGRQQSLAYNISSYPLATRTVGTYSYVAQVSSVAASTLVAVTQGTGAGTASGLLLLPSANQVWYLQNQTSLPIDVRTGDGSGATIATLPPTPSGLATNNFSVVIVVGNSGQQAGPASGPVQLSQSRFVSSISDGTASFTFNGTPGSGLYRTAAGRVGLNVQQGTGTVAAIEATTTGTNAGTTVYIGGGAGQIVGVVDSGVFS